MNTSGSRPRPQPAATPPDLQIPAAFPPPTPPPLDTPGRPGSIRAHLPLPLVARGVRDDNAGNRGHRRLRPVKGTQRTGVLHASGFPGRNRPRRETDLVTVAKLLVRVVLGLAGAFFGCQHVPVPHGWTATSIASTRTGSSLPLRTKTGTVQKAGFSSIGSGAPIGMCVRRQGPPNAGPYCLVAALNRATSSAGTRPRSFTSMPCALAHSRTSVLSTPSARALRPLRPGRRPPARRAACT